jgi:uncharacterized protein (TIGR01319 family)
VEVLLANAEALASARWPGPVVVAGNSDATETIGELFNSAQVPFVLARNVVPEIGVLHPDGARAAIREMFVTHVIGGKHLSRRAADFTSMVQGATPDVVLRAVELLSTGFGPERPGAGDVVVVDVGGATTDVHSVVELDPEEATLSREVVASTPVTRTVEGDLGMRWSATSTVAATDLDDLAAAAEVRHADPGFLPTTDAEYAEDEAIAAAAVGLALRRHAGRSQVVVGPDGRVVERTGKDLREVRLLVGSGGVLRHGRPGVAERVLGGSVGEVEGGWQLPVRPRVVVDHDYVLAAGGLLATRHPEAAYRLVQRLTEDGSGRATRTGDSPPGDGH